MTAPVGDSPVSTFLASLGARGRRRAEPRLTIALAGAGCALAVLGVLMVAAETGSDDGGSFNRVPGILLTALLLAAGAITMHVARRGPLATAGAVAAVLGVPSLLFFLTADEGSDDPLSTGVVVVATVVWLGGYLAGPAKGRPIFLAAALLGGWATVLQLTVDHGFWAAIGFVPAGIFGFWFFGSVELVGSGDEGGLFGGGPDYTTLGLLSITIAITYLLVSRYLDRRDHQGVSTPFAVIGILALVQGVAMMVIELEVTGTGLLAAAAGVALAAHGATTGRRATTWIGAGATVVGLAMVFGDMSEDTTVAGLLFLAVGVGVVVVAQLLTGALDEPDEMVMTEGVRPLRRPPITIVPPSDTAV